MTCVVFWSLRILCCGYGDPTGIMRAYELEELVEQFLDFSSSAK